MRVLLCSSGGKDSVLAWHFARQQPELEIVGQLTTFTAQFNRVTMHGVRRSLIEQQAAALGLPLYAMELGPQSAEEGGANRGDDQPQTVFVSNDDYEALFLQTCRSLQQQLGIQGLIFGDIFLEEVRAYRERLLAQLGLQGVYPLWGKDSAGLMETFCREGFQARVVCVDSRKLDESWCGRLLDAEFVAELPAGIDPCGENGEFHSFVFAGPGFAQSMGHAVGEKVWRDPFWFAELLPQ